ncbi:hypothetical protein [Kallotenue papyrolyticum]|uniref:hypothetical protein n=1 Tax=Kallotenue papyrolyticum TaxID=1325125 RepID=UPI00047855E7|nr:hypothetical protein [Kallotenue papyrolyticum]
MRRIPSALRAALGMLIIALLLAPAAALAHEHREVGPYEFTVGFINEPAFENEQNGIWLRVVNHETNLPVEGLADTLRAEVIKGSQQRELKLKPAWNEPGVYTAVFYPTEPGDYTFRFYGQINGTPVDESFTSSPDGFDGVQPVSELQFPRSVPTNVALAEQLAAAQATARTALVVGALGLLIGLGGLVVAALALRRRTATLSRHETPVPSAR